MNVFRFIITLYMIENGKVVVNTKLNTRYKMKYYNELLLVDSSATISQITFQNAEHLQGRRAELSVVKVGGQVERKPSFINTLPLVDTIEVNVKVLT